jgi:hypothetical protein
MYGRYPSADEDLQKQLEAGRLENYVPHALPPDQEKP